MFCFASNDGGDSTPASESLGTCLAVSGGTRGTALRCCESAEASHVVRERDISKRSQQELLSYMDNYNSFKKK